MSWNADRDWSVHPGETLRDALDERGMSQAYLAFATGYSLKHVNRVVRGHDRLTPDFALALEREMDLPAHVLVRIQADHDLWTARRALNEAGA